MTRMSLKKYRIAVVGATGAVGREFLRSLEERRFPLSELRLLASARSRGKKMTFGGQPLVVQELNQNSFKDVDIAFFSAGGSISKTYAPLAVQSGAEHKIGSCGEPSAERAPGDADRQPSRD